MQIWALGLFKITRVLVNFINNLVYPKAFIPNKYRVTNTIGYSLTGDRCPRYSIYISPDINVTVYTLFNKLFFKNLMTYFSNLKKSTAIIMLNYYLIKKSYFAISSRTSFTSNKPRHINLINLYPCE